MLGPTNSGKVPFLINMPGARARRGKPALFAFLWVRPCRLSGHPPLQPAASSRSAPSTSARAASSRSAPGASVPTLSSYGAHHAPAPTSSSYDASCASALIPSSLGVASLPTVVVSAPLSPLPASLTSVKLFAQSPQGYAIFGPSGRLALAADGPSGRLSVADPVSLSLSDDDVPLSEWATRQSSVVQSEPDGPSSPGTTVPDAGPAAVAVVPTKTAALDLGPAASSGAAPYVGGARACCCPSRT